MARGDIGAGHSTIKFQTFHKKPKNHTQCVILKQWTNKPNYSLSKIISVNFTTFHKKESYSGNEKKSNTCKHRFYIKLFEISGIYLHRF